jgi:threonine dehydrogenase-like Zn-dependent dehydrogenase
MPLPFIGGHEMAGTVEELGEGVSEKEYPIGQRVSVRALYSCGKCYYCRQGKENLCVEIGKPQKDPHKEIWGPGGLGEYLVVQEKDVYLLPDSLPFKYGAFTEPLACVVNSLEQAQIELSNDVVIIGGGIMGLLHVMLCKLKGARVMLSEPDPIRRKLAEEAGADGTINPLEEDIVESIKEWTKGLGADVVINTTAISQVAEQAIQLAGKVGTVVMYSSIHPDKPIEVSPNWIHNTQVKITGAVSPSIKSFQIAANLLSKGLIVPDKLISNTYPLEETQKAFEEAVLPNTYRIIVTN